MKIPEQFEENTIFPVGEKIENEYFTGTAWLSILVPPESAFNCPTFNVTFEPGARNNWHRHPGGQILLITGGTGYYQEGKDGTATQKRRCGEDPAGCKTLARCSTGQLVLPYCHKHKCPQG